jgi:hypothetical protein
MRDFPSSTVMFIFTNLEGSNPPTIEVTIHKGHSKVITFDLFV